MALPLFDVNAIRILVLVAIAIIYAGYDLFNKRDIPDIVAYASVAIGIAFTLTLGVQEMEYSALVAIIVGALSYFLYRIGQLGLGDGFEFVAISLLLPMQPAPYLSSALQFNLPFILSVFIATGIAAVILVPISYLSGYGKGALSLKGVHKNNFVKAAIMLVAYAALFLFDAYMLGAGIASMIVVALVAIPSAIMVLYEKRIMMQMVRSVYPKELDDGDIIAIDLMSKGDISYFRRRSHSFGRLATKGIIARISNVKRKIPVYKNAIPLAFPTLIGVLVALLFGNVLLYLV